MGRIRVTVVLDDKTEAQAIALKAKLQALPEAAGATIILVVYNSEI